MWNSIMKRLNEPSTFAGLAGIALATDQLNIFNEGTAVAQTLGQAANEVASGNSFGAIATLAFGLFAIFKGEKGGK